MNALKKTWIWLCRFRKRKGYGVHSPFAYSFIRTIINEKGDYYGYSDLKPLRKNVRSLAPLKVDKLLFRMANFFQPAVAIKMGAGGVLSLKYIQAGCKRAKCVELSETAAWDRIEELQGNASSVMLYIGETERFREIFEAALPFLSPQSVVVVDFPYESDEKLTWWYSLENDERVGLTFDLYELGIVLFDDAYSKQHYKVNFI